MKFYYSGKTPDARGAVQVHSEDCQSLPDILGRIYLGLFPNGNMALDTAKTKFQISKARICKCCD
ncbi:hypothetical protein E0K83_01525 [Gramella sp. BOM4]|nr:hypothetical protein [Christiangramia bathymodioli]